MSHNAAWSIAAGRRTIAACACLGSISSTCWMIVVTAFNADKAVQEVWSALKKNDGTGASV